MASTSTGFVYVHGREQEYDHVLSRTKSENE
jgi:hypothetical protein